MSKINRDESYLDSDFQSYINRIRVEIPKSRFVRTIDMLCKCLGKQSLILYGAGEEGCSALDLTLSMGVAKEQIFFCDTYKRGLHRPSNIKIITPDELFLDTSAFVLITTARHENDIYKMLISKGYEKNKIFLMPSPHSLDYNEFAKKHLDGYYWAYEFFKDSKSRKCVIGRAKSYLTGEPLKANSGCDAYYEDGYIQLNENEIFVDVGAYSGDTAEEFILKALKLGGYRHVYAFEPTIENSKNAYERLLKYQNVEVINKGVLSFNGVMTFYQNDEYMTKSGFQLDLDSNDYNVNVISLDSFFADKTVKELPSFIKVDVEGSEKDVLLGSANIIKLTKPKLAIRICHKPEDVYELPRLISSFRDDYNFALRQHLYCWYDTMLYAY